MRGRTLSGAATTALAAAVVGFLALPAGAADDDLDLVSRATGGAAADGTSAVPRLSADGRHIAFVSDADNLSDADGDTLRNAFIRDLATGTTTLLNRADGATGAAATSGTISVAVSADGRVVAFDGPPALVDPAATATSILVRDVASGTTTLVSRASGASGAAADDSSFLPAVSADGRYVAFESTANNLSDVENEAVNNVFLRDRQSNVTSLISRAGGPGGAGGDAQSLNAAISADGRYVAFSSSASNLSDADTDGTQDVFVRDRTTDLTVLVSRASGATGAGADAGSGAAAISADGRFVAFTSSAGNLSTEDADAVGDVFVRDLVSNTTTLVSRANGAAGAPGSDGSGLASISGDGRFVTFASLADNLSDADDNAVRNVFVRDLLANTTSLVSRASGAQGAPADGTSFLSSISADGRHVAFESDADNLSDVDVNAVTNLFQRTLPQPVAVPGPTPGSAAGGGPSSGAAAARCAGVRATIVGTNKRNVIRGTAKRDVIAALGGNDLVRGLGGNDLICLGAGNDKGIGGAGADRILGQAGTDREEGGAGADVLEGGAGRDLLLGGAGIDRLLGLAGRDRAVGGAGRDICKVEAREAC